jgi:hypothetical protein
MQAPVKSNKASEPPFERVCQTTTLSDRIQTPTPHCIEQAAQDQTV